ncbi:MAG: MarR family EPS-associated transcriptional regulator [bacterium]|nr:MarR family EPS-associated transcriptional regulator [bacterium]
MMASDPETVVKVLDHVSRSPESSQREIAAHAGISLGKANYILKALIGKGMIKTENFLNNKNKWGYRYVLTSKGVKEKVNITKNFVRKKMAEYEKLLAEHE